MKGFCYIENGRVVVNEKKKPEFVYTDGDNNLIHPKKVKQVYQQALSAWEDKNIRVENAERVHDEYYAWIEDKYLAKHNPHKLSESQPVDFDEKTCKITKIN